MHFLFSIVMHVLKYIVIVFLFKGSGKGLLEIAEMLLLVQREGEIRGACQCQAEQKKPTSLSQCVVEEEQPQSKQSKRHVLVCLHTFPLPNILELESYIVANIYVDGYTSSFCSYLWCTQSDLQEQERRFPDDGSV